MTIVDQAEVQAPPAPPIPVVVGSGTELRPLSRADVARLREARSQLSSQLSSAENRRQELVQELRTAPEAALPGMQQRLKVLDDRIAEIERDIQTTGRQLALAPREYTTAPSGPESFVNTDAGEFAVIMGTIVMALSVLRLVWVRSRPKPVAVRDPEIALRMTRLEEAVDAIAIEVERVGESQRYQAKLLAEGAAQPIPVAQRQGVAQPIPAPQRQGIETR